MSNNKPHFSYINVSLLVLSNLKIVFLKKLKKNRVHCIVLMFLHIMCGIFFWSRIMVQKLILGRFWPCLDWCRVVTSKIWISRCVFLPRRYQTLRSYSFVSRIRTLVKTLRHHVTILDLFRTLLDPSYYMIHINIVLVNFSRGYY